MFSPQDVLNDVNRDITAHQKAITERLQKREFNVTGGMAVSIIKIDPSKIDAQGSKINDALPHPNPLQARRLVKWLMGLGWSQAYIDFEEIRLQDKGTGYYDWSVKLIPDEESLEKIAERDLDDRIPIADNSLASPTQLLEELYPIIYTALWLQVTWNDHNFPHNAHHYITEAVEQCGITRGQNQKAEQFLSRIVKSIEKAKVDEQEGL